MPWAGRCVWVTRPARQAGALCAAIRAHGGEALAAPLLEIEPPNGAEREAVVQTARAAGADALFFFVSANAVHHGLPLLREAGVNAATAQLATVGRASEAALRAAGCTAVIAPQQGFDSEAVLALPEFAPAAVAGRTVVILRGDGGRALLGEELARRGVTVRYVTVYHRHVATPDALATVARRAAEGGLDAAVLTSSEAARALPEVFAAPDWAAVRAVPVFCGHPRVAESARCAGCLDVRLAEAGDDGLILALNLHFSAQAG